MDIQEAKRIQQTVEVAVLKAVKRNLRDIIHQALQNALRGEIIEDPHETDVGSPLRRSASQLLGREVRNGVLSPMPGGRCELVWLALDALRLKGNDNLQALHKVSDRKKWNWNNSRTEFYRWKRFHDLPLH